MGRRNRKRAKKHSPSKSTGLSPYEVPSLKEMCDTKEYFSAELSRVFGIYLNKFQLGILSDRHESVSTDQIRTVSCYDSSNELSHIFDKQLIMFIEELREGIKVNSDTPMFASMLTDASVIVKEAANAVQELTSCIFEDSNLTIEDFCAELFNKKVRQDDSLFNKLGELKDADLDEFGKELLASICNVSYTSSGEETQADECVDREIEEFKAKLSGQSLLEHKFQPIISKEWVMNLRNKIKIGIFQK